MLRIWGDEQQVLVSDIAQEKDVQGSKLESFAEHTRAFLQVQNGCDAFCSYCIVPYARGRSRSVPMDEALAGIGTFAAKGYQEVVLTGIHLGAYGLDLAPSRSLLDLLAASEKERLVDRVRVGSVEPTEISDELIAFLAGATSVCPHLHIPLQSGQDRVLTAMNRNYSTSLFARCHGQARLPPSPISVSAPISSPAFPARPMPNFRRATGSWQASPSPISMSSPSHPAPGTPAATMEDQLHSSIIKERAKALRRLSEEKKKSYYRRFIGQELQVLVQHREEDGLLKGLSRNYIPVFLQGDESLLNTEQSLKITELVREKVTGEIIKSH